MYTIRYVHRNNIHYVASHINGHLIVIESIKSEFRIGHQISYEDEMIFNLTLNEETDAVMKLKGDEKRVYEYLLSSK
ncbi:hypothetical protein [Acinetobacter pittii]|uniref:hypothetical protein n=1 Tax=Acinetobacter pittii TaxID=48296 RepID=UPI0039B6FB08